MKRTEVGKITPGTLYVYHERRVIRRDGEQRIEDVDLGTFRVEGFATAKKQIAFVAEVRKT